MKHSMIQLTTLLALAALPWLVHAQSAGRPATMAMSTARERQPLDQSITRASILPWRQIEGLWDEQVEQVDCTSGAPLHPIGRGTNLFIQGGSLIATNNAPPTVMGPTLGQWWYGRDYKFHVKMRLNLFQPPLETFLGVREIERDITLSNHGTNLAGVVFTQDYAPDGTPNGAPICATETGIRVAIP
jgi:hypothetical protein